MQISYLVLLGLFSYFIMIDLAPGQPSVIEAIVWAWSLTMVVEMVREVRKDQIFFPVWLLESNVNNVTMLETMLLFNIANVINVRK
jgi:hypothetical protein